MTDVRERAHAAIVRADATLREPNRETAQEWAMRAPDDPDAIVRWLRDQPDDGRYPEPPAAAPPPAPAPKYREVAALKATVEKLRREVHMLSSGKERRRRKMGRAYLTADTGGR